ncbi:MAG: TIGR02453 family protein [Candidatus Eremiobacteraeota bacterium]|nr:TIGR02453 family protein [Candidatus Eremiobacteraeota bacterium]
MSPELFDFFRELKENNNREWFEANKKRYHQQVRDPLLGFVEAFAPHLESISPHFLAEPRANGGSMFRIYRDVRFSKNKSPYKTHAALQFRHEAGRDVHAPGFYLHLEPGNVFCGAGLWRPDSRALNYIRQAIDEKQADWKKAIRGNFRIEGDSLKRPPRGFSPDHPLIEALKRKDHVAVVDLDEKLASSSKFLETFTVHCQEFSALMRFLTRAVGLPF